MIADGDYLLDSGATLTIAAGLPVSVLLPEGVNEWHATFEIEALAGMWIESLEGNEDQEAIHVMTDQPTHRMFDDANGERLVLVTEHAGKTCALDREEMEEAGFPPYCDAAGVWRSTWDEAPIQGARVEPLATEVQA